MQTEVNALDWERGFQLNLSTWADLEIAKRRCKDSHEVTARALKCCIYYQGHYVMTVDLVKHIEEGLTWNTQIYEAWNYGRCEEIHKICRGLSPTDADALLHASGYADVNLNEVSNASDKAVQEAWDEMYGGEEEEWEEMYVDEDEELDEPYDGE